MSDSFEDFVDMLEDCPQPESCTVDNPDDCETCGS